ncbi:centrosomal protein of 55 kDa [Centroberyx affinis]|uniref:centrosomal protein of 55 kDa n=1 Tax=Centroberyx affinis TaxID=166261 RepID=UPI003A5B9997
MTSKGAKETIVTKLGFKSGSSASKAEVELERVRKENTHLRRKMDELAKRHIKPPDSDKSKLLERILSLEMLRERNNQQLLVKEQELETLRQQLSARGGEVVVSLQAQLEQRRNEAVQRDRLFQTLSEETQSLKNKLAALETQQTQAVNGQVPPGDLAMVQDQLRDALEKNQQWLVYDQQRETYVQSVVVRTMELEQQLAQANQALQQQPKHESSSDAPAKSALPEKSAAKLQGYYDQLLLGVQKDLETQRDQVVRAQQELQVQKEQTSRAQAALQSQKEQVTRLQEEMSALQGRHEDKCRELSTFQRMYGEQSTDLEEAKEQLQAERVNNRHAVCEERMVSSERADRMRGELESMDVRLEEERKRSAELLLQVNLLQKSLLSQNEEQRRIAALEQQIQLSAKDFENEKIDRQSMQHQLHKVLKELRKARDQITRLESAKQPNSRFSEPSSYNKLEFERLTIGDPPGPTSPSKVANLLDESFLECPKCRTPYATSQHRELLTHIDYCFA